MADLDDFFSKRDKRKKAKSKFSTLDTDEFAKQLEATTATEEASTEAASDAAVTTQQQASSNLTQSSITNNETGGMDGDEWKPFESDENKDYSGLRIKIQQLKEDDEDCDATTGYDENEKKPLCPWGSSTMQKQDYEDVDYNSVKVDKKEKTAITPAPVETKQEAVASANGAYISPAMKRQMAEASGNKISTQPAAPAASTSESSGGKYVPPNMRNKTGADSYSIPTSSVNYRGPKGSAKGQPNINDTSDFPTLGGAVEHGKTSKVNGFDEKFEVAKKSARVEQKSGDNEIDLINKFTALSTDNN